MEWRGRMEPKVSFFHAFSFAGVITFNLRIISPEDGVSSVYFYKFVAQPKSGCEITAPYG